MTRRRTRIVFGSRASTSYVDIASKELMESVIQLPPAVNDCVPDATIFLLPDNLSVVAEDYPGRVRVLGVGLAEPPETVDFSNNVSRHNREAFANLTIYREFCETNQTSLPPSSQFYQIQCRTKRTLSTLEADGNLLVYETAQIWAAPLYDVDNPHQLVFQKHRGFVELVIPDTLLSTEAVMSLVRLSLPECFHSLSDHE